MARDDGSSPRMRGAVLEHFHGCLCERIIPAHAGSRNLIARVLGEAEDHPRACGEQSVDGTASAIAQGSSPRMRGAGLWETRVAQSLRIIPAHAGSSPLAKTVYGESEDHPRACGEQKVSVGDVASVSGSSPRMRGAGIGQGACDLRAGIIPAHAGSRLKNELLNSLAHFSSYSLSISFTNRSRVERQSGSAR